MVSGNEIPSVIWRSMERSVVFGLLLQFLAGVHLEDQTNETFRKYSTKTTYKHSVEQDEQYYNGSASEADWSMDSCDPVLVLGLFRHGIRYPGENDITNIAKVIFKMKVAGVAPSEVDQLEAIANKFLLAEAKDLAAAGRDELHGLGERFGRKVAQFKSHYDPSDFEFFTSNKLRAIGSCESFKSGFAEATGLPFGLKTSIDDHLLRFFDECSKYVVSVAENRSALVESSKIQQRFLPEINARLAKRLGVHHLDLLKDEVKAVLVVAATELAIFGSSTWSRLLSDEDLELLEYASDVKNYWKKGYGYRINYEPGCVLLSHMFQQLDDLIIGKTQKKAAFYFGHTETVIPVLSILGLFHDAEPLMADNYDRQRQRQFRTTRLSPFASNVAFVLSKCSGRPEDSNREDGAERFYLRLLFKERPLVLPACGRLDCPYSVVRKHYSEHIDACNFTGMCWVRGHQDL